eukprot:2076241-Amphidinium_carterae.2
MSTADSEAYFFSRAKALQLPEAAIESLKAAGLTTSNLLAYSTGYMPMQTDDTPFTKDILEPILGANPDRKHKSALRRLFVESYTIAVDELQKANAISAGDPPPKVTVEEKASRLKSFRDTFPGVQASGDWEPSSALIGLCAQQHQYKTLAYIPWTACTSRPQE